MDYEEALLYLKQVQQQGAKLALYNIQKIIDNLPFDIAGIKFIQVAGTNGKGSTAHFLTSILQEAGKKVGLFTSPHLQDIRERITIDKSWIPRQDFASSLTRVKEIAENLLRRAAIDNMPTFFEHIFLTALCYFSRRQVDFAVLEVGLGGRLDATSTITPEVSVITNISLDHTKTLGRRIRDIAAEKAGIIKPGVPVVCGCSVHSISNRVIEQAALEKGAPFFNVLDGKNRLQTVKQNGCYHCTYAARDKEYKFKVYLNGAHQAKNAAAAVKAIYVLSGTTSLPIPEECIYDGIAKNFVPGRIEILDTTPPTILDGGHNIESIKALRNFLQQEKKSDLTLVFGVLRDKKYRPMVSLLLPFVKNVILTEPVSNRALPAAELGEVFSQKQARAGLNLNIKVKKNPREAIEEAFRFEEDILVTGSLYLAGVMRNIISGGKNG
ncbi:MAG: hypothetical protein KAW12_22545 [Candidatus Aminicenantes bacterium]|nr:hypothetical protein [Candidatus Aminicenantes bacterium]